MPQLKRAKYTAKTEIKDGIDKEVRLYLSLDQWTDVTDIVDDVFIVRYCIKFKFSESYDVCVRDRNREEKIADLNNHVAVLTKDRMKRLCRILDTKIPVNEKYISGKVYAHTYGPTVELDIQDMEAKEALKTYNKIFKEFFSK